MKLTWWFQTVLCLTVYYILFILFLGHVNSGRRDVCIDDRSPFQLYESQFWEIRMSKLIALCVVIFVSGCVEGCTNGLHEMVFVLDSANSVGQQNFNTMKQFVKSVTQRINVGAKGTHVGVITSGDQPVVRVHLTDHTDVASLGKAIDSIPYVAGSTGTKMALDKLATEGFTGARPGAAKVGIVVISGKSPSLANTAASAKTAHGQGITLFALGVGLDVSLDEMAAIASEPDVPHIFRTVSFAALQHIVQQVTDRTCNVVSSAVAPSSAPAVPVTGHHTAPASGQSAASATGHSVAPATGHSVAPATGHSVVPVTGHSTEKCADTIPNCADYGSKVCTAYKPWATARCSAFCRFCTGAATTPGPPCVNKIDNCFEYGTYICSYTPVRKWTREHCLLYCNWCSP